MKRETSENKRRQKREQGDGAESTRQWLSSVSSLRNREQTAGGIAAERHRIAPKPAAQDSTTSTPMGCGLGYSLIHRPPPEYSI